MVAVMTSLAPPPPPLPPPPPVPPWCCSVSLGLQTLWVHCMYIVKPASSDFCIDCSLELYSLLFLLLLVVLLLVVDFSFACI